MAAMADAHAASVTKFGPWKSKMAEMRPAMMLASSPGIESSFTSGSRPRIPASSSLEIASRWASGSRPNVAERASSSRYSGA